MPRKLAFLVTALIAAATFRAIAEPPPPAAPGDTADTPDSGQTPPSTPEGSQPDEQIEELDESRRPPVGLLERLPDSGQVPSIAGVLDEMTPEELAHRAMVREYTQQIRRIRHKHFGEIKVPEIREAGLEQLREFTDPAAFQPMVEELAREADDVRLAVLDHFGTQGDPGQGALGWVAIHDPSAAMRNEATRRMVSPPPRSVLLLLNSALRSKDHAEANMAGALAGALNVTDAIPLLIFTQAVVTENNEGQTGDVAWIAIETQRAYVQGLIPVAGDNSAGFAPIIGTVSEGTVLRVVDAYAIVYRTFIHNALVSMSSAEWGKPTDYLAYDIDRWWQWYNDEYVPMKNRERLAAELGKEPPKSPPATTNAAPPQQP